MRTLTDREIAGRCFLLLQLEYDAAKRLGLALQHAIKFWEAPTWVDAQFAKSLEQLIDAEEKNPEGFWNKQVLLLKRATMRRTHRLFAPAEEKQIKQLLSDFKKKTDKIVREYARIERPANLHKEQLAWRMFLT
jgi:DNA-directed RNA polymerase subunit beta'